MCDPRINLRDLVVTEVHVTRGMKFADVYVSNLSVSNDASRRLLVELLDAASGFLRSALARRHSMRTTPKLRFHYDDISEEAMRIEALIGDALRREQNNDNA